MVLDGVFRDSAPGVVPPNAFYVLHCCTCYYIYSRQHATHTHTQALIEGREFIVVLVGSGHHSAGLYSKLGPGVVKFLESEGYTFVDVSTDGRGGALCILVDHQ